MDNLRAVYTKWLLARMLVLSVLMTTVVPFTLRGTGQNTPGTTPGTWDLSKYAPECKLMLRGKLLNTENLTLTTAEWRLLVPLLQNEDLPEKMYVWSKLASLIVHERKEIGPHTECELNVEELDKVEGDMVVSRDVVDVMFSGHLENAVDDENVQNGFSEDNMDNSNRISKRATTILDSFFWKGEIPWQFAAGAFNSSEQTQIREVLAYFQDNTCVRFQEFPPNPRLTGSHIQFIKSTRCYSSIGRQKSGQKISIGSTCFRFGTILHEVAHALGLFHEHNRPDRDMYITINTTNIIDGNVYLKLLQDVHTWTYTTAHGVPYDYSSNMHYSGLAFSKNFHQPTINTKEPNMQHVIGQRQSLSFLDLKLINSIYTCQSSCGQSSLEWDFCKNSGYRDPNNCNQCKCPTGLAPPSCVDVAEGINANCSQTRLTATETEKSLTSPGYPEGYPGNADCAWLISAPVGHRIRLEFKGTFVIQDNRPTCFAYVEVRYKIISRTGARYCWYETPGDVLLSHGEEAMVLLHTRKTGYRGFNLTYRAEKCGGCSENPGGTEPTCLRTETYDCGSEGLGYCGNRICIQERQNTCFRESSYCCQGYQKSGDVCRAVI